MPIAKMSRQINVEVYRNGECMIVKECEVRSDDIPLGVINSDYDLTDPENREPSR